MHFIALDTLTLPRRRGPLRYILVSFGLLNLLVRSVSDRCLTPDMEKTHCLAYIYVPTHDTYLRSLY